MKKPRPEEPRFVESQRQLIVQASPELLRQTRHDLVRDADETHAEYAARIRLFETLLDHARHG